MEGDFLSGSTRELLLYPSPKEANYKAVGEFQSPISRPRK